MFSLLNINRWFGRGESEVGRSTPAGAEDASSLGPAPEPEGKGGGQGGGNGPGRNPAVMMLIVFMAVFLLVILMFVGMATALIALVSGKLFGLAGLAFTKAITGLACNAVTAKASKIAQDFSHFLGDLLSNGLGWVPIFGGLIKDTVHLTQSAVDKAAELRDSVCQFAEFENEFKALGLQDPLREALDCANWPVDQLGKPDTRFCIQGANGSDLNGTVPAWLRPIFERAGLEHNVPWQLLAAINWNDTEFGANPVWRTRNPVMHGRAGWIPMDASEWEKDAANDSGSTPPDFGGSPYDPYKDRCPVPVDEKGKKIDVFTGPTGGAGAASGLKGPFTGVATTYTPGASAIDGSQGSGSFAPVYRDGWAAAKLGTSGFGNGWSYPSDNHAWHGWMVRVINLKNHKAIEVPIADIGPGGPPMHGKQRIIDLLPLPAKALGGDNPVVKLIPLRKLTQAETAAYARGDKKGLGAQAINTNAKVPVQFVSDGQWDTCDPVDSIFGLAQSLKKHGAQGSVWQAALDGGSGESTVAAAGDPNAQIDPGPLKGVITKGQAIFSIRVAMLTGMDPNVIKAWALAEMSGSYATGRERDHNYNWLNIGYFDSLGGHGAFQGAGVWSDPITAADASVAFLEGKFLGASASIQQIRKSAGKKPLEQLRAIWTSNWATSHYSGGADLRGTYKLVPKTPQPGRITVQWRNPKTGKVMTLGEAGGAGGPLGSVLPSLGTAVPGGAGAADAERCKPGSPDYNTYFCVGVSNAGSTSSAATVAAKVVELARAELKKGVHEQPMGSNLGPDLQRYVKATKGGTLPNPWCAYFASYIARQAGSPIGANGSGIGYVPDIRSWAQQAGKWIPGGSRGQPGDLIVFPGHVGIVEQRRPGGYWTIEGNESDKVSHVQRSTGEPVGFVRLGPGGANVTVTTQANLDDAISKAVQQRNHVINRNVCPDERTYVECIAHLYAKLVKEQAQDTDFSQDGGILGGDCGHMQGGKFTASTLPDVRLKPQTNKGGKMKMVKTRERKGVYIIGNGQGYSHGGTWGLKGPVEATIAVTKAFQKCNPDYKKNWRKISDNDWGGESVASKYGFYPNGHLSHRNGADNDYVIMGVTRYNLGEAYSRTKAEQLASMFLRAGAQFMFFNDPAAEQWVREARARDARLHPDVVKKLGSHFITDGMQYFANHENHFHVRWYSNGNNAVPADVAVRLKPAASAPGDGMSGGQAADPLSSPLGPWQGSLG